METIVCATRGGEGGRAAQRQAIKLARERRQPLVFLYVLDASDLGEIKPSLLKAVRAELTWLGKALVNAARQRARAANVEAEVVIREGDVQEEICNFLKESQAGLLLLGASRGTTATVFGDDAVERFATNIKEETGVAVEVVRPEPVIIDAPHKLDARS